MQERNQRLASDVNRCVREEDIDGLHLIQFDEQAKTSFATKLLAQAGAFDSKQQAMGKLSSKRLTKTMSPGKQRYKTLPPSACNALAFQCSSEWSRSRYIFLRTAMSSWQGRSSLKLCPCHLVSHLLQLVLCAHVMCCHPCSKTQMYGSALCYSQLASTFLRYHDNCAGCDKADTCFLDHPADI